MSTRMCRLLRPQDSCRSSQFSTVTEFQYGHNKMAPISRGPVAFTNLQTCAVATENSSATAAIRSQQTSPFNAVPCSYRAQSKLRSLNQKTLWQKLDQ